MNTTFVLQFKDGSKKTFYFQEKEDVLKVITNLLNDYYNVTEDIKEESLKKLRNLCRK